MISLLLFLFILGILIIVHEFGHFIAARRAGVKIEKFAIGFGPRFLSRKRDDTEYSICVVPLGGYVKLAGDSLEEYKGTADEYLSKPIKARARIIFFGPFLNYVLGIMFFWLIFSVGYPTFTTKVGGLLEGFGAKAAGIQIGDKIIAVDNKKVAYWEDLQKIIYDKKDTAVVRLTILRDNKEYVVDVKIRQKSLNDLIGQKRSVGLLGITPSDEIIVARHRFFKSLILSINKAWDLTVLTYRALWRIVTGKLSLRESVTGPLGMFFITSKAARLGTIAIFHLIAILNISLAIFNLLPLPVLDGGHLFLLVIEKIRGRHLSLKAERFINNAGFALIVTIAVFVTYNDIVRYFGERIAKFLTR